MIGNAKAQKYTARYPGLQQRDLAESSILYVEICVVCGIHNQFGVKSLRTAPDQLQVISKISIFFIYLMATILF